ncbi:ABC transporter ATP-binding protein [Flindersiella endophytica]
MSVITTGDLTMRFPGVTALDQLTVSVEPGVTGLVGANGAGKSTLIKILLGLLPATSGSAQVLNLDVRTQGPEIRQRVGYMPEHDCLPPDVSAAEFVVHLGRMSGLPMTSARERTSDILRHVGLYEERYRPIGGYSTGMKQRVKLAQALVHDPQLVFLDEPTNGLDPAGRDEMLGLIRRIGSDFGISVLVTSHLLGELERIAGQVVIIDGGRLLRSSTTADFTRTTERLQVEVISFEPGGALDSGRDILGNALAEKGVVVTPAGRMLDIQVAGEETVDLIRDLTAQLGLGLVRMEQHRHHIDEVFRTDPVPTGAPPAPSGSPAGPPPGTPAPPTPSDSSKEAAAGAN